MHRSLRLPIALLGFVMVLAILASGSFLLNKWLPQPATYVSSTGSPPGSRADDPSDYLPDTGLVQLTSPISTTSYYISNFNLYDIHDLGRNLGIRDSGLPGPQDDVVILDYGYPSKDPHGAGYGVISVLDQNYQFYPNTSVANSVEYFATGYFNNLDLASSSHLTIVVGVVNCCVGSDSVPALWPNHGAKWAQEVVDAANYWLWLEGMSNFITVSAGMDIERDYNFPYASRQWLDSYISQSSCIPGADNTANGCFFDFGNMAVAASGTTCQTNPPPATPTVRPGSPTPVITWTGCDVWYPAWGAQRSGQPHFARPLPEIYHGAYTQPPWGSDANAWATLSVFSDQQMHAGPILFAGSLTQREDNCYESCKKGNNVPWEGFQLLSGALASNTTSRQAMRWSTDMKEQPTPTP
jgi:hypothetical protein